MSAPLWLESGPVDTSQLLTTMPLGVQKHELEQVKPLVAKIQGLAAKVQELAPEIEKELERQRAQRAKPEKSG